MGWALWFIWLSLPDRFWTEVAAFSSVLFLSQSLFAPDRTAWMDPGPGSLLALSGAADAPCDQQIVLPSEKE